MKYRIVISNSKVGSDYPDKVTGRSSKYKEWQSVSMEKAVTAVEQGMSIRRAAESFAVPRSTLHDRTSGKIRMDSRSGRKPYLTVEEEEELVCFLLRCAKIGYAHTRKQVLVLVQQILESKGIDVRVSSGWWERFCQRHPNLSLRTAVPLSLSRAMATDENVINRYYDLLEETLRANDIFNDPRRIYNCDETGVPLNPKPLKVIDAAGSKNPSYLTGETREQVTVLACTGATGTALPPCIIFKRKTFNPQLAVEEVPGSFYGLSANGWINAELFQEWFSRYFLASVPPLRPLLLLLDGHSSHYCPEVIRVAAAAHVILFALPPHTTHLSQPLDKGVFASLKMHWREVCHDFLTRHPGRVVTRYDFCALFSKAWSESVTIKNVIAGFRTTGVFPFNRMAIDVPKESFVSFEPEKLSQKSGLAFIPLYSPAPSHTKSVRPKVEVLSPPVSDMDDDDHFGFSRESDDEKLDSDCESSDNCLMLLPRGAKALTKFLHTPVAPFKLPTKNEKCPGKVLTSVEYMRHMEARDLEKQEKLRLKEERRLAREDKKKMKQEAREAKKITQKARGTNKKTKQLQGNGDKLKKHRSVGSGK